MPTGEGLTYLNTAFLDDKKRFRERVIEDIPIMINETGGIVCIPKTPEVFNLCIAGMSVDENTLLYFKLNDKIKYGTIKEVYDKFNKNNKIEVLTISEKNRNGKIIWSKVKNVWFHGKRELIKIKAHGKEIKVTPDHSLFCAKSIHKNSKFYESKAEDLKNVVTIENLPLGVIEKSRFSENFLTFLGLWIADGNYSDNRTIEISTGRDEDIINLLTNLCKERKINFKLKDSSAGVFRIYSSRLYKQMKELFFEGDCYTKKIPPWIKELNDEELGFFLKGYFSGDGSFIKKNNFISCGSVSLNLLKEIQILLNRFNIVSTIGNSPKKESFINGRMIKSNINHKLLIGRQCSIKKYFDNIGFIYPTEYKEKKGWALLKEVSIWKNITHELSGEGNVYDIEVPETECFVADGFLCHNSGKGKSLLLNRIIFYAFHSLNANCCIINDVSNETYQWSERMENKNFLDFNKQYLEENPCALPIVHVFQNTESLKIDELRPRGKPYLKIVIPFSKIIENIKFFLEAVSPDLDAGKSEMYINKLKSELLECTTLSQVRNVLEEGLPGKDGKTFGAMRTKILSAFERLYKEEITDITNPECISEMKIDKKLPLMNPFSALMKERLIPSLNTVDLINKKYKAEIFNYHISSIFENNLKDFPGEKTFICADEMRDVCEKGKKEDEPAIQSLGKVGAKGRFKNVGMIYATQFYNLIPELVKGAKLDYLVSFRTDDEIAKKICADFTLSKKWKDRIQNLEKFECVAMTRTKFIIYYEGERWETSEPQKGVILYPLSSHIPGGVKI